jgi:homoserine kinase
VLVLCDGPGGRQEAKELADSVTDTPWEGLMLAVDVRGGTVRERAEGST